jgi:hypothetical protein
VSARTIDPTWSKLTGGALGSLVCIAVFTPWGRHAPCPVRPGMPAGCDGPWTNILGWDFYGAFPVWVPLFAALAGFAIGWFLVALLERLVHGEKASALG